MVRTAYRGSSPAQHLLPHLGRRVRQQHLAHSGGVQRQHGADLRDDRHRPRAAKPLDDEHAVLAEHAELDVVVRGLVQVLHVRECQLAQPGDGGGLAADAPQPRADAVRPVRDPLQEPARDQLADEPVPGRQRQPRPPADLAQVEADAALREGVQDRHHLAATLTGRARSAL
nr:hypothetical protein [Actinomadura madurae]